MAPIIVEHTFTADIQEVWNAITKLDSMKKWFFENIEDFVPEVGFETRFNVKTENREFFHLWKITEAIPPRKIKYNWKYEGFTGDSFVAFELFELGKQTTLILTHEETVAFPKEILEFSRESCMGGWNYFIKQRLPEFLNNK